MVKKVNPNLFKIHRNYTVEEVAEISGCDKKTVRGWLKQGLSACDTRRPLLILGSELRRFLQARRKANKRTCKPHEIYCVRCRDPKVPAGNMVDFEVQNDTTGRLTGICPTCDCLINRFVSESKLPLIQQNLEVSFPRSEKHINKCG